MFKRPSNINHIKLLKLSIIWTLFSCNENRQSSNELLIKRIDRHYYHEEKDCERVNQIADSIDWVSKLPVQYYFITAECKRSYGLYQEAIFILNRGISYYSHDPISLQLRNTIMDTFVAKGDYSPAIRLGNAIMLEPDLRYVDKYFLNTKMGQIYFEINDFDRALYYHSMAYELAISKSDSSAQDLSARNLCFDFAKLDSIEDCWELNNRYDLKLDSMIIAESKIIERASETAH